MKLSKIRTLLHAIHAGHIRCKTDSADVLDVSTATFSRWVRYVRKAGVVIEGDGRKDQVWRVRNWGPYRSLRPR